MIKLIFNVALALNSILWGNQTPGSPPPKACLFCSFSPAPSLSAASEGKICTDLYEAACLDDRGQVKANTDSTKRMKEINRVLEEARLKAIADLGYSNLQEAYDAQDVKAGFDKTIIKFCNDDLRALISRGAKSKTKQELIQVAQEYQAFIKASQDSLVKQFSRDLPTFVSEYGSLCKTRDPDACPKLREITAEAKSLYRFEGVKAYEAKSEKFVKDNFELFAASISTVDSADSSRLKQQIQKYVGAAHVSCAGQLRLASAEQKRIHDKFDAEISTSKPFIEHLIDTYYTADKKKLVSQFVEQSRKTAGETLGAVLLDNSGKPARMGKPNFLWLERPPLSAYVRGKSGALILDPDQERISIVSQNFYDLSWAVNTSSRFFEIENAMYTPEQTIGEAKLEETLIIMPYFLHLADTNPYLMAMVIGHEVAHRFGPKMAIVNGLSQTLEYRKALLCFKDRSSIYAKDFQMEEVIADASSAEFLAQELAQLPEEQRRPALVASVQFFCSEPNGLIDSPDGHPGGDSRTGGIFGANPSIREAIGCIGESPKFKSCGLKNLGAPSGKIESVERVEPSTLQRKGVH